ncbi:NAD(P)/FAD-dependent oxidoreductase [Herbaspirillum lusitanum]|uniref:NAD(P)/FAD-dependent oxidoreductase n=1 Tax=Herbaspirillum lusitanum TaxID=213312 RepID=A0ABW9AFR0_9BURK
MQHDVIIVGASFAGISAAMQLLRARCTVLLIDSGKPRNRYAKSAHGFFAQDGKSPFELQQEGLRQLLKYPTLEFTQGEATSADGAIGSFRVTLADGRQYQAQRLILATGVRDELPAIAGMQERWGISVLHCPYCHGYEVRDQALGVIATSPMSVHQAVMIPDWGPTTYFTQGLYEPEQAELKQLQTRGVKIERSPVQALLGTAPQLEGVQLQDGRVIALGAIFTAPKTHLASPLAQQLGCTIDDGPLGPLIRVDDVKLSSVPGVFAAGDTASMMYNATMASSSGVMAGVAAHRSLIEAAMAA